MIDAGKIALRGSSLKMRSMAVFEVQSMRFIASWKPARTSVAERVRRAGDGETAPRASWAALRRFTCRTRGPLPPMLAGCIPSRPQRAATP